MFISLKTVSLLLWLIHKHCQQFFFFNLNYFKQENWSLRNRRSGNLLVFHFHEIWASRRGASEESSLNPCDSNLGWKQTPPDRNRPHACWYPDRLMSAQSLDKDSGFNTQSGTDRLLFLEKKTPAAVWTVNGSANPASHTTAGHMITHTHTHTHSILQRLNPRH